MYHYRAQIDRVVAADTLDASIDCGFGIVYDGPAARLRLDGIDTASPHDASVGHRTAARGVRHAEYAEAWVDAARRAHGGTWPFVVHTKRDPLRVGRYVARVHSRETWDCLNDALESEFGTEVTM